MPSWSEPYQCAGSQITVHTSQDTIARLTCSAAQQAQDLFARCNIPPLNRPLKIEVVTDLKDHCTAIYHCGEGWIEILEPSLMQGRRTTGGAFSFLQPEAYYQSVVVHELAHVAFDNVPCPYDACIATNEYLAYTMQVMSLPPDAQQEFAQRSDLDKRVSRDELSAIILLMAPGRFAQLAWAHLSQHQDPCSFVGHIMDGTVRFDRERF